MTCIAFKDGIMAADTLEVIDGGKTRATKLVRVLRGKNRGDILGIAGGSFIGSKLLLWYSDPAHNPLPDLRDYKDEDDEDGARALIYKRDGSLWLMNAAGATIPRKDAFFAIGCGAPYAIGAMAAGLSASRAVRIACRFDPYCALPVQTMRHVGP